MAMSHIFRRAPLSDVERTKRVVALTVAEAEKPQRVCCPLCHTSHVAGERHACAPPLLRPAASDHAELGRALNGACHQGEALRTLMPAEAPPLRPEPDCPVVTITIAGPRRGGKSVIAHLIRAALAREGVVAEGPEGLRSLAWHRALETLRERGISVVLRRDDDDKPEGEGT